MQQDLGYHAESNQRLEVEIASQQKIIKEAKEKLDATEKRAINSQDELSKSADAVRMPHLAYSTLYCRQTAYGSSYYHGDGSRA